jgi:hypothetical protein
MMKNPLIKLADNEILYWPAVSHSFEQTRPTYDDDDDKLEKQLHVENCLLSK